MTKNKKGGGDESGGGGGQEGGVVEEIIAGVNKRVGRGTACLLNSEVDCSGINFTTTGNLIIDTLISNREIGGFPCGRLSTVQGSFSSGKSLLCAHAIAEVQKQEGIGILLDSEHSVDKDFLLRIGVQFDKLIYIDAPSCEDVFECIDDTLDKLSKTKKKAVIVWDSVASSPTRAEVGEEIDANFDPGSIVAYKPRVISKSLAMLIRKIEQSSAAVIFTNQLRTDIRIRNPYISSDIGPGGKAIPFFSSLILDLSSGSNIKDANGQVIGVKGYMKILKSRLSPPLRKGSYSMFFDFGINNAVSIYDYLIDIGVITKKAGYRYMDYNGQEINFREPEWQEKFKNPDFREYVSKLAQKQLIIKYEK